MQEILQAEGTVGSTGVLQIQLDRTDIGAVSWHGHPVLPSFQLDSSLNFQPLGHGKAFFNGDVALLPGEILPVIDAIVANDLEFQAEHQHFYDFEPMVWFIHLRGRGNALDLARRVHNVVLATATPLPQAPPSNPTTPLDADRLMEILHGDSADVGEDGVVTISVSRNNPIRIAGIVVDPDTNIATTVVFEPLDDAATNVLCAPDFSMEAKEINGVTATMRGQGWDIGCLYNQETDEHPQLFFEHAMKQGDPYQLAAQVRNGLDKMNVH
jgi:hypothetical protein